MEKNKERVECLARVLAKHTQHFTEHAGSDTSNALYLGDLIRMDRVDYCYLMDCIKSYVFVPQCQEYDPYMDVAMQMINHIMGHETGCTVEYYSPASSPRSSTLNVLDARSRVIVQQPRVFAAYLARTDLEYNTQYCKVRDILVYAETSNKRSVNTNVSMTKQDGFVRFQQLEDIQAGDAVVIFIHH